MLQLILGIAGSGKTTRLLDMLEQRAGAGQGVVFLVPEQFSSSAEMLVYNKLGDEKSAGVEVLSFRTLAERVLKACGGLDIPVLSDAGRVVFVRRALDVLGEQLGSFARHRRSAAFCCMCADVISEFKIAGATPEKLYEIAKETGEQKFADLALIYEAYESAISGLSIDPEDRLALAADRADCGYFKGKEIFIDNFDGFTAPEYHLLESLLPHCAGITVALCCNHLHETDGGLGVFSPVRRAAQRLLELAHKAEMAAAAPVMLSAPLRQQYTTLKNVNLLLAGEEDPDALAVPPAMEEADTGLPCLTLTCPAGEEEEMQLVAAHMRGLALQGVAFSSMAVVCRDMAPYESALRRACAQFDIPVFVDAPSTIEYTAPVAFVRAALGILAQGFAATPLLALLKTGLCGAASESIAALENYVFTWAPRAAEWRAPFTGNPDGLLAGMTDAAAQQLAMAEGLRAEYVPVIEEFLQNARGRSAGTLSKQLYLLMDRFSADIHLETMAARFEAGGEADRAEATRRAWDLTMDMLDQMAALLPAERLTPSEYDEIFLLLVRATDFGQAPQTLECAVFTTADRMRLAGPEYCFVVGASEGDFPMQVGYSGLLTHADRDILVGGGIEMPGSFEHRTLLEEMFFYRALTTPRKGLFISWPKRRAGGAKVMSAPLEQLKAAFAPPPLPAPLPLLCATPMAAFDVLGSAYRENTPAAAAIYKALQTGGQPSGQNMLHMLQHVQNNSSFAVRDTTSLAQLVGDKMTLSATRAERYYECRFSYYMERVLGVKPRRKAEISPLESGTFVHYVLEQVLREAGAEFAASTDDALHEMAGRHAQEFIEQNLPVQTKRAQTLLHQIKQTTASLLCYLRDGAAQSDFTIQAVEMPLDGAEGVPPLEVHTPDGRVVRVSGQIDRVDVLHRDGKSYLSIIDYKTGGKKFNLADVYCGINMQMMIYMQTLKQNGGEKYPNPVPAAVLYLTGDPAPVTGTRGEEAPPAFAMDGLLLDDPAILQALDKQGTGVFLPVKHKAGVASRAGEKLAGLEKMGGIGNHVEKLLAEMADGVYRGEFSAVPLVNKNRRPCEWCAYRAACRHEDGRGEREVYAPQNAFLPDEEVGE